MRINKFIALATSQSRRKADHQISKGLVKINNQPAKIGQFLAKEDKVTLNGELVNLPILQTIVFHKPVGLVCSHNGQGNATIYDKLPKQYANLNPVGRLDKNSSGLLLLSNDGDLIQKLTHPKYNKQKQYLVSVTPKLSKIDKQKIETGIILEDGLSKLGLKPIKDLPQLFRTSQSTEILRRSSLWQVTMSEGRNRQIRRTFKKLDYRVLKLHRTKFGAFDLGSLPEGEFKEITKL